MRIPSWAEHASLKLNGGSFSCATAPGTYAAIQRVWKAGDTIALNFPMPIRLMEANPKAKELHNKVAVMRGPLVYCLEVLNQEGGAEIWRDGVFLPENIELTPEHRREFLGGVTVLKGKALTEKGRKRFITDIPNTLEPEAADWHDLLYRPFQPRSLKHMEENTIKVALIPYYAWANRGHSRMTVWIPLAR